MVGTETSSVSTVETGDRRPREGGKEGMDRAIINYSAFWASTVLSYKGRSDSPRTATRSVWAVPGSYTALHAAPGRFSRRAPGDTVGIGVAVAWGGVCQFYFCKDLSERASGAAYRSLGCRLVWRRCHQLLLCKCQQSTLYIRADMH